MTDKINENNESRDNLIKCAKQEFLEKGFAKASLRKIAADAGLTTGAVYFFFGDKNGLLEGVVGDALGKLMSVLNEHLTADTQEDILGYKHQEGDHDELVEQLVDVIYDNIDEMTILLKGSGGSKYENFLDGMIDNLETAYISMAQQLADAIPGKRVNRKILHWLCHVQINAFMHMVEHEPEKDSAMRFIKPVMDMLVEAWVGYALEDDI